MPVDVEARNLIGTEGDLPPGRRARGEVDRLRRRRAAVADIEGEGLRLAGRRLARKPPVRTRRAPGAAGRSPAPRAAPRRRPSCSSPEPAPGSRRQARRAAAARRLHRLLLAGLDRQAGQLLRAVLLLEGGDEPVRRLRDQVDGRILGAVVLDGDLEIEGRARRAAKRRKLGLKIELRRLRRP